MKLFRTLACPTSQPDSGEGPSAPPSVGDRVSIVTSSFENAAGGTDAGQSEMAFPEPGKVGMGGAGRGRVLPRRASRTRSARSVLARLDRLLPHLPQNTDRIA